MFKRICVLAVGAVCLSVPCGATTIIDTTGAWNGAASVQPFGETNTATYGQTFIAPLVDTRLDSFTFYVDDFLNPDVVDFAAYVMAWDGLKATGPVLFASGAMSTTNNHGAGGFEAIQINTGGLNLIAGNAYVAFFSASNFFDGSQGTSQWGQPQNSDQYNGGGFVFQNNGNNFGLLTTNNWSQNFLGPGGDLAFNMTFNQGASVPEPASMLLMGTGLVGAGVRRYRRRRA